MLHAQPRALPRIDWAVPAWCRHAEALNQREICGLYRTQLLLRPSASRVQLEVSCAIMKYVARTGMMSTYPDESSLMEKVWGDTLVQSYIAFKSQGLQMTTFWAAYKDVCAMVMPLEDTEALFQAQGKWTSVEDKGQQGLQHI